MKMDTTIATLEQEIRYVEPAGRGIIVQIESFLTISILNVHRVYHARMTDSVSTNHVVVEVGLREHIVKQND